MVYLIITPRIRAALKEYNELTTIDSPIEDVDTLEHLDHNILNTVYTAVKAKKPKAKAYQSFLDFLDFLHGSDVYEAPPLLPAPPKKTPEYEALMKQLRAEDEERQYRRMLSASASASSEDTPTLTPEQAEEMSWKEVKSQVTVIFNILLSTFATAAAVWRVASGWDVPERMAIAFVSALVVCIAEVVLFIGYVNRLEGAKKNIKKKGQEKEKVEVVNTWEVGGKMKVN